MKKVLSILNIIFNISLIGLIAQTLIFTHLGIISVILGIICEICVFLNIIKKPLYNNFSSKLLYIFIINILTIISLKWCVSPKLINVNIANNYKIIFITSLILAVFALLALIMKLEDNSVSVKTTKQNIPNKTKKEKVVKKETVKTTNVNNKADNTKTIKTQTVKQTNNSSSDEDDYI